MVCERVLSLRKRANNVPLQNLNVYQALTANLHRSSITCTKKMHGRFYMLNIKFQTHLCLAPSQGSPADALCLLLENL